MNARTMSPAWRVAASLARNYRPAAQWFWAIMLLVTVIAMAVGVVTVGAWAPGGESGVWVSIGGTATKWWLLTVAVLLVVVQLRVFVANGITRRDFTAGALIFSLAMTAFFTAIVLLGALVENMVVHLVVNSSIGSELSIGEAAADFGHLLPVSLAYLASGALGGAAYYRFNPWIATVVVVLAAVPLVLAEFLLGITERGGFETPPLPYAAALPISLAASAICYLPVRRLLSDVAIRRTAS